MRLLPAVGAAAGLLIAATAARAQTDPQGRDDPAVRLVLGGWTRVVDPKLPGGTAAFHVGLSPRGATARASVVVWRGTTPLRVLARELPLSGKRNARIEWDGRDRAGRHVGPGTYRVVVALPGAGRDLGFPVHVVRLGFREIAARAPAAADEWQMVYFRNGSGYAFTATPALHEYRNAQGPGERAELDHDDGRPRAPVPLHTDTRRPALAGTAIATAAYNYPLAFRSRSRPRLSARLGANCIDENGAVAAAGYPIPGVQLRCAVRDGDGVAWTRVDPAELAPGTPVEFEGPRLPSGVTRTDVELTWRFEWTDDRGANWREVPGALVTAHRFYTQPSAPVFAAGASGTQYAGPWVDVVDRIAAWGAALGSDTTDEQGVLATVILGFGGQVGALATAIENVRYDCYPLGGNGGASHYYLGFPPANVVQLSRLLDDAGNGPFVNCSDCASSTAVMAAMAGVRDLRLMRLGSMNLNAIRGIGAPDYTVHLWGPQYWHRFSYHHTVTRDGGVHVYDACLWVDDDANPAALPGTPGHNVARPWDQDPYAYRTRLATNAVGFSLDPLPRLQ